MLHSQLEAIVRAAVEQQITVAELNVATRTLPDRDREEVYAAIRRRQRELAPRFTFIDRKHMVSG
jgi:hypothetical protein